MQRARVIPTVKVVHMCPPILVQTDSSNFRFVVQELTGKRKSPHESDPKTLCSLGDNDNCNLAVTSQGDDQCQSCHCTRSRNWKTLSLSDKEESARKSDTRNTSYSDDSQQEVTSTLVDCSDACLPGGPRLKKSKLGGSNRVKSADSKSSTPDREDTGAPAMITMDMLVSEIFSGEEALHFAPTPPGSPLASPSSIDHYSSPFAAVDIFSDLYDDREDEFHKLEFFLLS